MLLDKLLVVYFFYLNPLLWRVFLYNYIKILLWHPKTPRRKYTIIFIKINDIILFNNSFLIKIFVEHTGLNILVSLIFPTFIRIIISINRMIKNLTTKGISHLDAIGPASVKIIEQATFPQEAVGTSKSIILMVASLMSILLGLILV